MRPKTGRKSAIAPPSPGEMRGKGEKWGEIAKWSKTTEENCKFYWQNLAVPLSFATFCNPLPTSLPSLAFLPQDFGATADFHPVFGRILLWDFYESIRNLVALNQHTLCFAKLRQAKLNITLKKGTNVHIIQGQVNSTSIHYAQACIICI